MGYFYQNPPNSAEPHKCYWKSAFLVTRYVHLPSASSIYELKDQDDIYNIEPLGSGLEIDDDHTFWTWRNFHSSFERLKRRDGTACKCPWPAPWKSDWFEKTEEKKMPCHFFYLEEGTEQIRPCPYTEAYFPLYIFPAEPPITNVHNTTLYWYVVHPDENERMERILNGTDNPLYDLVHELRYNPAMPAGLSAERKEAQERFEENTAKRARTE